MTTFLIPCAALAAILAGDARVPVYTNDDLDRLRPLRAETGGESTPAVRRPDPHAFDQEQVKREAYWRGEAERVRLRVQRLRQQAAVVEGRIADASTAAPRGRSRVRGLAEAEQPRRASAATAASLAQIEAQIRDLESRLEERARREGALPGWLR